MSDLQMTLQELKSRIHNFHVKRQWDKEDPKDIALSLALEAAEVLELFQWKTGEEVGQDNQAVRELGDELIDVIWYVVMMASQVGIDLEEAFERKYAINQKRWPEELFEPGVTQEEREKHYQKAKRQVGKGSPGRVNEKR